MTDPAKDGERLADLPPIKTAREQAMRETIHGQGLSMVAMDKELREKDVIIARLTQERDAACKAHVECAESLDVATRERDETLRQYGNCVQEFARAKADWLKERDEARRSTGVLQGEVERLKLERERLTKLHSDEQSLRLNLQAAAQPIPDDVERARVPTLLKRAEQLWDDLQKNELGGFSGINRPFWIVQAFKEVDAAARREGAELRALDEAVIAASRAYDPLGWSWYDRAPDDHPAKSVFLKHSIDAMTRALAGLDRSSQTKTPG